MEMMRPDRRAGDLEWHDPCRLYMNHTVLVLEWTLDQKKAAARNCDPVALKDVRRKNDIGDSGFIFKRQKNKTLCCARPLTRNHASSHANVSVRPR